MSPCGEERRALLGGRPSAPPLSPEEREVVERFEAAPCAIREDDAYAEWQAWEAREWAAGRCPSTGYARHVCHIGPCDCFDPAGCSSCGGAA